MSEAHWQSFKERLDDVHDWPCIFTFKFVMPAESLLDFKVAMKGTSFTTKQSSKGRYISATSEVQMTTSSDVVEIYRSVSSVTGVIML